MNDEDSGTDQHKPAHETFIFDLEPDKIELIGDILLDLQEEVRTQIVSWATQLVIQTTSEQIKSQRKRPVYVSEKPKDDRYLDLDLDSTIENLIVDPSDKTEAVRVFNRAHSGHSVLLIIDSSYSMSGKKLVMAAAAASTISHLFSSRDIAVIHFGTKASILKHFDHEISTESLVEQIFSLVPRGLTNLHQGLKVGIDELGARKRTNYTAILLSDCDLNTGKVPSIIAWRLQGLKIITFPPVNEFVAKLLEKDARGEIFNAVKVLDIPFILQGIFENL